MTRSFKVRHICATAALALLNFTPRAGATNLLQNGGFEAPPGTGVDSLSAGWSFVFDCQRSPFHTSENFLPGGGGARDIWLKTFEPLGGGIQQTFSDGFTAGATYTLNAQFYAEPNFTTSNAVAAMELDWMDSSGNLVGTPSVKTIDPTQTTVPTGSWTQFTLADVAPAGSTQVQVYLNWSGGTTGAQNEGAFFDNADLEGPGNPPPPLPTSWVPDASGDWNSSNNWATGLVPNSVGIEADLLSALTSNHTVFSDTAITVGTLTFNNSHTYVLAGAGSLTLQAAGSASAVVNVQAGVQEINLPTVIASNTTFNVATGANLVIADPLTINAGKTITPAGGGTITYESIINVLGGGGIVFSNATHAAQLNIASAGTASITGTSSVLTIDSLSNSGKIDVKTNSLKVAYGSGADPSSQIQTQLTSGYNGGAWNGTGINSSSATSRLGVGWKDDTAGKSVLVKFTYDGDTNLDGQVNTTDFTALSQHFNATAASAIWVNGDFNYDGKVNALDFNYLATNFGATPLTGVSLGALVPEPVSAVLILPAALLLAGRRRRIA